MSALLLALWSLLILPPAPPAWRLIVLTPPDRPATAAELAQAGNALSDALDWWRARGFDAGTRSTVETQSLSGARLPDLGPGVVAVVVTDTLLFDRYLGLASEGHVWVTTAAPNLPAVLAHELGHAVFWLSNGDDTCVELDIMCPVAATAAYRAGFVGCRSLAALGRPCHTIALPEVVR